MIPADKTIAPCQRKIDATSLGVKPIERKMAISLVFSITRIANTLNIPKPDNKRMQDTVIAEDTLKALNTSNHTRSLSCQLTTR